MDNLNDLSKIDIIRERMKVTYQEAKAALDQAEGDLIAALIALEQEKEKWTERIQGKGEEVLQQLKDFLAKNTAAKVRLKKDDKTLLEIPASAGMLGAVGMLLSAELAVLGAVGTVAAMLSKCTLEIEREEVPNEDELDSC